MSSVVRPTPLFPLADEPEDSTVYGEVHTHRWVVELILDLVGYRPERDLAQLRLVEPACGDGAFLKAIARRVSASCRRHGRSLDEAHRAVRALDLLPRNVDKSREAIRHALSHDDWDPGTISRIATEWVRAGDYLLSEEADLEDVDFVVGNPPYIRLEDVPERRMRLYRRACPTMTGRADVYIGFFESAIRALRQDGTLGYICADRWMRNQYGRDLRRFVGQAAAMDVVVSMHDVDAFRDSVAAYPAITVLRKGDQAATAVIDTDRSFGPTGAAQLSAWCRKPKIATAAGEGFKGVLLPHWFSGEDYWPAASPARLAVIEDLNDRCAALGDPASATRVGIGVATGADAIFITTDPLLVEQDRLLPLAMAPDTRQGRLSWSKHYLVNPWDEAGRLVNLSDYPMLARYLGQHADLLSRRHVGRRQPHRWYRTIDKVSAALTAQPKLLFPDMKLTSEPVLDPGGFYPHHNLYYVVSDVWDLRVLGGLLLSKVAESFIDAYAVKMRGGTLRFQAQYLRRIRLPHPDVISAPDQSALADAFDRRDAAAATVAALRVYGIDALPD